MAGRNQFAVGGFANALINLPIRLFFGLLDLLPHETALKLMGRVASGILAGPFGVNRRIRANLALIYPDMAPQAVKRLCRQVADNSGRLMLESFNTGGFIRLAAQASFSGAGKDALLAALQSQKPVVLVSGHFGNYQVIRVLLADLGYDTAAIYRPMNNAFTNARYIDNMNRIAGPNFSRGMQGTKALLSHLRKGGAIALLNDQYAVEGAALTFMGQPARTMTSAAEFALKYKALLFPYYGLRLENGVDFAVTVEAPIPHTTPEEMTQRLNDSRDAMVRKHPGQWFWIHKRWKPDR